MKKEWREAAMDILLAILFSLILIVSFHFYKHLNFDKKEAFPQYPFEALRWLKNDVLYQVLKGEIQTVTLNPSDDKSRCYQINNLLYSEEMIRTSDVKNLREEITVNGEYLKSKLQENLYRQFLFGQIPNLKILGIAVENGKFIIVMELIK